SRWRNPVGDLMTYKDSYLKVFEQKKAGFQYEEPTFILVV
ncbi:MAG: hypothetical protein ACI9D8_001122, partial [Reinekea sp.]